MPAPPPPAEATASATTDTPAGGDVRASGAARVDLPHITALDGARGLAVAGVLLYHFGFPWMPGGYLGVSLFFTLSGFLITSLLLAERAGTGHVDLRAFWGRRFRRLLPAALAGLALAVVFGFFAADADQLRRLPGDVISALLYVANWHFILSGNTYAAGYQEPSPVLHYWSLGIEEQFYVLFPLAVTLLVVRRLAPGRWVLVFALAALASMVWTIWRFDPVTDQARIYFGTDTRIVELLAGVLLALVLRGGWTAVRSWPAIRWVVAVPLAATVALWVTTDVTEVWLYEGGFWLVSLLSVGVVLAALSDGPVSTALSWRPLAALGLISYGVYLYHWPVVLWLTPERTGLDGVALTAIRLAATLALALLSYRYLEMPVRRRTLRLTPATATFAAASIACIVGGALYLGTRADARAVEAADEARSSSPVVTQPPLSVATTETTAPLAPPTKVLMMGDSLLHQAFPVFESRFAAEGIEARAVGAPGETLLENDDAWLTELQASVDEWDPDVVVLEACCGHDTQRNGPVYAPDGTLLEQDTPEMWAEWQRRAAQAVEIASSKGAVVLWTLAPPAQTNGYYGPIEQRIGVANEIYLGLAPTNPYLGYVDWRVISGPDGQFVTSLPNAQGEPVQIRHADGLHFTPAGMDLLFDTTSTAIDAQWQVQGGRATPDQ